MSTTIYILSPYPADAAREMARWLEEDTDLEVEVCVIEEGSTYPAALIEALRRAPPECILGSPEALRNMAAALSATQEAARIWGDAGRALSRAVRIWGDADDAMSALKAACEALPVIEPAAALAYLEHERPHNTRKTWPGQHDSHAPCAAKTHRRRRRGGRKGWR